MELPDSLTITWTLVALFASLFCWYLYRHFTQLRRRGIPGPTPWPLFGNLLHQFIKGFEKTDAEWLNKYGQIVGFYNGYQPAVLVTDPELLKMVLVKNFPNFSNRPVPKNIPQLLANGIFFMKGRKWKKTRNILTPTFSAAKLKYFLPIINSCAETLVKHLEKRIGENVPVRKSFSHFTMDAIASTAFGIDIDSQNQPNEPFVTNIDAIFQPNKLARLYVLFTSSIPFLGDAFSRLGLSSSPSKSLDFYEQTGQALIDERKKQKMPRVDFIELLMNAELDASRMEYVHNGVEMGNGAHTANGELKEKLTDYEVNAQAFTFFLAGFETTASLLRYATYMLALRPDIDEKLCNEISENIGEDIPTYDNIGTLKYMDQFISETLRFYPPVPRLSRLAQEDLVYKDMVIPKGTSVVIPAWSVHHDPNHYPDPETFDPDRFAPEKKSSYPSEGVTFLPWGLGPRHCIGMRLAQVEAKVALVHLLRNFRFEKCDQTQVPLDLSHVGLLRPRTPITLRLQRR
ncbi:cytochrome P450 3A41-like [Mya arenaria]|uniref:cytochrome P450 3A41-like n=1 Tax=Mya arenaria TaxID=6604 RepID=UPI0022E7AE23|nr:cytochrome P450 3A41-like [Mya arenaria]